MIVFIVIESDFGSSFIQHLVNSIDKAQLLKAELEQKNTKDWVSYRIEEWNVE